MLEESVMLQKKDKMNGTKDYIVEESIEISHGYLFVKRILDIAVAVIGIAFFAVLYPLIAIAIKIDSRGPIIFRQERVGQHGKKFKVYKFRTMVENAEDLIEKADGVDLNRDGFIQQENDPRVTRVGRVLRSLSIDELPQFINILKGEMSLVGPRPFIELETKRFKPEHKLRLLVKPGLTGYAQVSGRNDLCFEGRMEKDIYYVRHISFILDLQIVFRTFLVVFKKDGVY